MWTKNGKKVTKIPKDIFGFTYRITTPVIESVIGKGESKVYFGSKQFYSNRTKRLSKKRSTELYSGKGRKPTKERVQSESDWKTYQSSSATVKKLIQELGIQDFKFEILEYAKNKADLHVKELITILKNWENPSCLNLNIKFNIYKKNL